MIQDSIDMMDLYAPLIPHFDLIKSFLHNPEWRDLPIGHYELDGNNVYVNVDLATYRSQENALLESHKKYIDIQIPLECSEKMGWQTLSHCNSPINTYDIEHDITFWKDNYQQLIHVNPDQFVLFFNTDAHAPIIGEGTHRKIVIKIKTT